MKRTLVLALIVGAGIFVSYAAASAASDDGPPPEWLDQPGQADPTDPNPDQVAVTGTSPEQATYELSDLVAENLAKAEAAAVEEEPVPGDRESLEEIYRRRADNVQRTLDQICLQLEADNVFPAPCG